MNTHNDLRELVRAPLKRAGHRVTAARNGDDVSMPVRDGFEVLDRIRVLTDLPVMMLTAASAGRATR